jgi:hypothetical protein
VYSSSMMIQPPALGAAGTKDGSGAGDCDQPYVFGRRPRAVASFPFTAVQFSRLLRLRGRVQDGLYGQGDLHAIETPTRPEPASTTAVHPWGRCSKCTAVSPLPSQLGRPTVCDSCRPAVKRDAIARAVLGTMLDGLAGR